MKLKKFYKYHKKHQEKDLLEQLLNRRRKMLAKMNSKESNKAKPAVIKQNFVNKAKNITKNKTARSKVSTVFKSIGYRKSYNSLNIAMKYVLKNAEVLENEQGTEISIANINKEITRFDLKEDIDNLKTSLENTCKIEENHLKNRQIWHAMFSLPNNKKENKEAFKAVVREASSELLHGHKYLFAVHENTKSMHVHLVVRTKNDITGRQLRVNPKELEKIHELFHQKCLEHKLNLTYERIKNKQPSLTPAYSKLKTWKEMYEKDEFAKVATNKITYDKLASLGMDDKNINSFLHMYKEDKKMAIWTVNKNAKIFNIKNQEGFTLRKVELGKEQANTER